VGMDVMVEMAFAGARVLHSRAVELAAARRIGLHVRNTFSAGPGTLIPGRSGPTVLERWGITAVTHDHDVARVLVRSAGARRGLAADLLEILAAQNVGSDLVARSGPFEEEFRMGFTIRQRDAGRVVPALRAAVAGLDGTVVLDENVGKVSLVGIGLLNRPEFTARMLNTLADAGIATSWVSVSQLRTSVVVPRDRLLEALNLLHPPFQPSRPEEASGRGAENRDPGGRQGGSIAGPPDNGTHDPTSRRPEQRGERGAEQSGTAAEA